ncbi:hypothetical protein KY362_03985 [Candidatus Woesearchaeota archaeon]|nr:hypothetical protein [Candidatus Woesearchaeota archaeon]
MGDICDALMLEGNVVAVELGEEWEFHKIDPAVFSEGIRPVLEAKIADVQEFLKAPYVIDKCKTPSERKEWKQSWRDKDEAVYMFMENNALRRTMIRKGINTLLGMRAHYTGTDTARYDSYVAVLEGYLARLTTPDENGSNGGRIDHKQLRRMSTVRELKREVYKVLEFLAGREVTRKSPTPYHSTLSLPAGVGENPDAPRRD